MKCTAATLALVSCLVGSGGCGGEVEDGTPADDSGEALLANNGVALNGVALNGVALNGVALNGVALNGVALNGVALNGTALFGSWLGTPLSGTGLAGATMTGTLANGSTLKIRLDRIYRDVDPDIYLYMLSGYNAASQSWASLCINAAGNTMPAIPVAGRWRSDGSKDSTPGYLTFACRGIGAIAKCVDMKYKPWKSVGGVSLDAYHQACVRMVRGDYCGDGTPWTTNGRVIDVYDSLGIEHDDTSVYPNYNWWFEAEWNTSGARCMWAWRADNPPSCMAQKLTCTLSVGWNLGTLIADKSTIVTGTSTNGTGASATASSGSGTSTSTSTGTASASASAGSP